MNVYRHKEEPVETATETITAESTATESVVDAPADDAPVRRKRAVKADAPVVQEAPKEEVFYVKRKTHTFCIKSRDSKGDFIPVLDRNGREVFHNGVPVMQERQYKFDTISDKPDHFLCIYRWSTGMNPDVLDYLRLQVASPYSEVLDQSAYEKQRNPESYAKNEQINTLAKENTDLKSTLAEMQARLEALEKGK